MASALFAVMKELMKKIGRMTRMIMILAKFPASLAVGTRVPMVTQSAVKRKYEKRRRIMVEKMSQKLSSIGKSAGMMLLVKPKTARMMIGTISTASWMKPSMMSEMILPVMRSLGLSVVRIISEMRFSFSSTMAVVRRLPKTTMRI